MSAFTRLFGRNNLATDGLQQRSGISAARRPAHRRSPTLEPLEGRALLSVTPGSVDITSITSAADTDGNTTGTDEHVSVTAGSTVNVKFNYTTGDGSGTTTQHADILDNTNTAVVSATNPNLTEGDGAHNGAISLNTTGLALGNYAVKVLVTHKGNGTDQDATAITIVSAVISVTPTVTLSAPNAVYTGVAYAGASATTDPNVSGYGTTSIRYYATSADATADANAISAPTNVGTYYARAFYVSDGLNRSVTELLSE